MTVAGGTATLAELNTLYEATLKLEIALRAFRNGDGKADGTNNRFTPAQVDTYISAVSAAITAVNA